jgi:hypothetical protein
MKFLGLKDGGCEIIFEEHEIEIINKNKKLIFTKEFFQAFSKTMLAVVMEFEMHINGLNNEKDKKD